MAETTIPDKIKALLEPVNADAPTGEDLDKYVGPYEMLSYQFNGKQTDYKACAAEAEKVLKENSKHLQVISWLTVSWLMLDGLTGYRDGLLVMSEVLKTNGKSVFPSDSKHRIAALRYLGRENWADTLVKKIEEEVLPDKPVLVEQIQDLLKELANTFKKDLGEKKPDISELLKQIKHANPSAKGTRAAKGDNTTKTTSKADVEQSKKEKKEEIVNEDQPEEKEADTPADENESTEVAKQAIASEENGQEDSDVGADSEEAEVDEEKDTPSSIPDVVEELLSDISFSSKAGLNIEEGEDEDDNLVYEQLKSEMNSFSGNDYHKCVELCYDILQNRSKHLRVAVLLTISWYRTEGVVGLKNGFTLLDQLLEKYGEEVHPADNKKRIKIIQRLNSEARLQKLDDTLIGDEKAEYLVTDAGIKSLKDVETVLERALHKLKGQSIAGEKVFLAKLDEAVGNKATSEQKNAFLGHFQVEKAGTEQIVYGVEDEDIRILKKAGLHPDHVTSLGELSGKRFDGWMRCYDALSLEIGNDNAALYKDVLKAFLNKNLSELQKMETVYHGFVETCKEKLDPEFNWLETLGETIKDLAQRAREIVDQATTDLQEIEERKLRKEQQAARAKERLSQSSSSNTSSANSSRSGNSPAGGGEILIKDVEVKSAEDADRLLQKVLKFYVTEPEANEEEDPPKYELPLDIRFYGLTRTFKWGHLVVQPPDGALKAPVAEILNYYTNPPANLGTKEFIRKFEFIFLNNADLLFWLDGQRSVIEALEKLGEEGEPAAAEIKLHLARLLDRFPELPTLKYSNKKTTFASPETQEWLKDEVAGQFGGGGGKEKILPPILGEDYEEINATFEAACEALPDNFAENAALMQQASEKEMRQRGKFLIRLNLANFYSLGKHTGIARAKFNELIHHLEDYTVSEWEPALCVSMWQSAYVNNDKLLKNELSPVERAEIEKQQRDLFELIARYDGVLAHKLIEYTEE